MKRTLCAVLLAVSLATPVFAANVYLKDNSVIQAKKVWREGGKVHVLITRDTLTSFEKSEVNLKRTFPKRHRIAKKVGTVAPQAQTAVVTPNGTDETRNPVSKLPETTPETLVPSSGSTGTIKQHKKEMAERIGE